jgi:hypothetical protein
MPWSPLADVAAATAVPLATVRSRALLRRKHRAPLRPATCNRAAVDVDRLLVAPLDRA